MRYKTRDFFKLSSFARTINHHGTSITVQPNGHRVGSKNNNNFPGVFRKLYGNHELNFVNFNEAEVFEDSPDSKIPTLSEAMRGQNVTKLDLLARNEAVRYVFMSY